MSDRVKVSAIVTSYNHAEYLDQQMQALLAQSYQPLEIIVVDDCSTDNSVAVLEKYKAYPNVNIIALKENRGYVNSSNFGVSQASGDYIIFSQCDDYCEKDQIKTLLSKFQEESSIGVVYSSSNLVDEKGTFLTNDFTFREKEFKAQCGSDCLIKSDDIQMYLAVHCVIPNLSAAMIKKDLFIMLGGLTEKYRVCADWDLWCKLSRVCDFYYVREPYNNFRMHSTTIRNLTKIEQQIMEIMDLVYDHYGMMNRRSRSHVRLLFGMGDILMGLSFSKSIHWLRVFPRMYIKSIEYDKLNVFAPVVGGTQMILRKSKKFCNKIKNLGCKTNSA
ncbi:MAG: glycosyltransferase family 2 protein [Negativicutes bacterium]